MSGTAFVPPARRPSFDHMWMMYKQIAPSADESYPNGVVESLRRVGDKIGGHVKINIDLGIQEILDHPDSFPTDPEGFTNACAIRLSYVLNKSGVHIPKAATWTSVTGSDHQNYIYTVGGIRSFLRRTFGEPDIKKGSGARSHDFAARRGIIVFDLHFSDATGHATLWNGTGAADHDYFRPKQGLILSAGKLWACR